MFQEAESYNRYIVENHGAPQEENLWNLKSKPALLLVMPRMRLLTKRNDGCAGKSLDERSISV
jgi:hypothetical protein